jgi:hypothetical protein
LKKKINLKGMGHEIDVKKMCQTWTDLGINKGSGRFLKFSEALPILYKK